MANTLTDVIPQLLAQGLLALREKAMMPRLVNRGYENTAAQRGSTIDVPIPSAVAVRDVTPSHTPPGATGITPTTVPITLDTWIEAPFALTDKEMLEVMNGILPMQASEAIKALANRVNTDILALYKKFYGFYGTPGTTPFATNVAAATQLRKILNVQLAPEGDRRLVLDPEAEANALGLEPISNQSWRSNAAGIIEGQISRTMGFDWFSHQLMPDHTAGTGSGYLVDNGGGYAAGIKTIHVDTGTGTFVVGDIITFSTHAQTYVITSGFAGDGDGDISFYPGLAVTVANDVAITIKASHQVNLAFHRDAIAFATRPLEQSASGLGSLIQSATDAESGLTLRLEVSREHKQTNWSFDILYGCAVVRRELGARLAG